MCANSMWRPPPESAPSPPRRAGCGSVSVRAVSGERDLVGRPAEREGAGPANDSAGPWTRRQGFALGLPTAHTGVGGRTMHTHHTHTHIMTRIHTICSLGHCTSLALPAQRPLSLSVPLPPPLLTTIRRTEHRRGLSGTTQCSGILPRRACVMRRRSAVRGRSQHKTYTHCVEEYISRYGDNETPP